MSLVPVDFLSPSEDRLSLQESKILQCDPIDVILFNIYLRRQESLPFGMLLGLDQKGP